jgi:hypothetical protein
LHGSFCSIVDHNIPVYPFTVKQTLGQIKQIGLNQTVFYKM